MIVVLRGTEEKYVERKFFTKKHINCTVKPNKAKRFNTLKYVEDFWNKWTGYDPDLKFLEIRKLRMKYELA